MASECCKTFGSFFVDSYCLRLRYMGWKYASVTITQARDAASEISFLPPSNSLRAFPDRVGVDSKSLCCTILPLEHDASAAFQL